MSQARPELRLLDAAAQTGIVSVARIRLDPWESPRPFKGLICDDISEFEFDHLSHAVVSNRRSAKEKLRPEGSARRAIHGPTHVQAALGRPVPPLLGGRSFTIGPFYAKPELLIGFAAAVACTIALRFMLKATYLTFCRPSL